MRRSGRLRRHSWPPCGTADDDGVGGKRENGIYDVAEMEIEDREEEEEEDKGECLVFLDLVPDSIDLKKIRQDFWPKPGPTLVVDSTVVIHL